MFLSSALNMPFPFQCKKLVEGGIECSQGRETEELRWRLAEWQWGWAALPLIDFVLIQLPPYLPGQHYGSVEGMFGFELLINHLQAGAIWTSDSELTISSTGP